MTDNVVPKPDLQESSDSSSGGIFISHVSEDKLIADAFATLIQDVSAGAIPTFSSTAKSMDAGIKYGTEWFQWIREKITLCDCVVVLLTPRSLNQPWVLFEAGLGKAEKPDGVFGLAVGVSLATAFTGPFAVFQNSGSDQESVLKLCRELVEPAGLKPRDEVLKGMADTFAKSVASADLPQPQLGIEVPDPKPSDAVFQGIEDVKYMLAEMEARQNHDHPSNANRRSEVAARRLLAQFDEVRVRLDPVQQLATLAEIGSELGISSAAVGLRTLMRAIESDTLTPQVYEFAEYSLGMTRRMGSRDAEFSRVAIQVVHNAVSASPRSRRAGQPLPMEFDDAGRGGKQRPISPRDL